MLNLRDDSRLVCVIRPWYNDFLHQLYGRRGLLRVIHGEESIRLRPQHRLFPEDYESEVFHFLRGFVRPGAEVIEVGASIGVLTILMARWAKPSGHIHAFEPNPLCTAALKDHLQLNNVNDCVIVNPFAISDIEGETSFYTSGTSGTSSLSSAHIKTHANRIQVCVTTIDQYCGRNKVVPSLIKIDVEGFEFHVLAGAMETLRKARPTVLVELHTMNWPKLNVDPHPILRQLADLNYSIEPVSGQKDILSEYGHAVLRPVSSR
jgi:FkbM family methyltransferase